MTRERIELHRSTADAARPSIDGLRPLTGDDGDALGRLLYDAFHGGVDDEGETVDDAIALGCDLVAGEQASILVPDASWIIERDGSPLSSVVTNWAARDEALIAYVATAPDAQRGGLGRAVIAAAMAGLSGRGVATVSLWVTVTNPAVAVYERLGFTPSGRTGQLP